MTTQQVPHSPPLWRRVLSLPHTRLGWLSVVLIGVPVALFFGVIVYEDQLLEVPPWVKPLLSQYIPMALSLLAGAVVGLIAMIRSQERSVLVWLPLVLAPGLPIAFLVQWLRWMLRHEEWMVAPTVLFLVGMMALVAASHFLQRPSERYGSGGTISSVASLVGFALILVGALIGAVFQEWLVGTNVMGWGLFASSIGLVGLAIVTLKAGVLPWWGGVALLAANPLLIIILLLMTPGGMWKLWLVPVPILVVGFAILLAARRRTERPARVR